MNGKNYAWLRLALGLGLGLAAACRSEPLPDALPLSTPPAASGSGGAGGCREKPPTMSGSSGSSAHGGAGGSITSVDEGGAAGQPPEPPSGGAPPQVDDDPFVGPSRCTTRTTRDPNEAEGPEMNPGFPCNFCHTAFHAATGENDAPIFAFAGTLYRHAHEPDSCVGSGDGLAQVVVRDAENQELSALANVSGNFFFEDAIITPPYSVEVLFEGRVRTSAMPHHNPDCNLCHTEKGSQGARGRVVLP